MHGATNNFKMLTSPTSIVHTGYREAEGAGLECQRRWIGEEHAYTAPVVPSFTAAGWTASPGEAGGERTRGEGWGEEHIGSAAFSSSELRRLADASGWGDGSSPPIAAADVVAAPARGARSSPLPPASAGVDAHRTPKNICWHYIQGKCTAGDACKALHSAARLPPARGAKSARGRGSRAMRAAQIVARLALMKTRVKPRVQCERCDAHLPHIKVTGANGLHKTTLLRKSLERTGAWAPALPICHACKGATFTILVPSFDAIVSDSMGLSYDPASTKKPVRLSSPGFPDARLPLSPLQGGVRSQPTGVPRPLSRHASARLIVCAALVSPPPHPIRRVAMHTAPPLLRAVHRDAADVQVRSQGRRVAALRN
mgnify:CR=1 FL=1